MRYLSGIDYNNVDSGIEYLSKNKLDYNTDGNVIYHVYWYGKIGRKQLLCINSYIKTQNLEKTELWVWLDSETYDYSYSNIPNHKNIKIKRYEPLQEAVGTLLEGNKIINTRGEWKFRSDIARLIFLNKYGGLYYDLDMILLKDMYPLLGIEFCYKWSNQEYGNNGILRLEKSSKLSVDLIKKYLDVLKVRKYWINFNSLIFTKELDIMCFPSVMFDPVWILLDTKSKSKYSKLATFDGFFKKTDEDIDNFFGGKIYAYHWHSRDKMEIEEGSYFDKIENNIYKK